jgi:ribosomal protein S27E
MMPQDTEPLSPHNGPRSDEHKSDAVPQQQPAAQAYSHNLHVRCPFCLNVFLAQPNSTVGCPFCSRQITVPGAAPQMDGMSLNNGQYQMNVAPQPFGQGSGECLEPDTAPDHPDRCSKFSMGCGVIIAILFFHSCLAVRNFIYPGCSSYCILILVLLDTEGSAISKI